MQYPYWVVFIEADETHAYLVMANDGRQAERRARRQYLEDPASGGAGSLGKVLNLDPRQRDGAFLPRISGRVVSNVPCSTREAAVQVALRFLEEQKEQA